MKNARGKEIPSADLGDLFYSSFILFQMDSVNVRHLTPLCPSSNFACGFVLKKREHFYCGILSWVLQIYADALRNAATLYKHLTTFSSHFLLIANYFSCICNY